MKERTETQLYPYQLEALTKIEELFQTHDQVVLAACPSSGKTFMAADFIKRNSSKTFLILPHGTNFLDTQWKQELGKFGVEFSSQLNPTNRVTLGLPQRFYKKPGYKIDYLIVDEAHEFYYARKVGGKGMVEQIIERFDPDKILLLTGTPSRFIYENQMVEAKNLRDHEHNPPPFGIHIVPAEDLFKQGFLSDIYMGLATTKQVFEKADYNSDGDLKESVEIENVYETMDSLIDAMIRRISVIPALRDKPESIFHKLNQKVPTSILMKMLDKTLIVCNNINQADRVNEYLLKLGVKSTVSHSKNDPESELIEEFKHDPTIPVLVVVGRARLGFDMKTLINLVDFSCTRNVNTIYQMYARVMRKEKLGVNTTKFFFKLVPRDLESHYRYFVSAAIMMTTKEFISQFNGFNIGQMKVPVRSFGGAAPDAGEEEPKPSGSKPPKPPVPPNFDEGCGIIQLFIDIQSNMNSEFSEYSKITISEALARLEGKSTESGVTTEADLLYFDQHGEFPEVSLG